MMQNLRGNWLVLWKMTWGIWWTSPEHLQIFKFALWETFLSKAYTFWAKKLRGVMCDDTEGLCTIFLKKLMVWKMTLVIFHASNCKPEDVHFDGLVFSKAYKLLDERGQKSYVSWDWRVIQRKANSWEICICVMQWTWSSQWKVLLKCSKNLWEVSWMKVML